MSPKTDRKSLSAVQRFKRAMTAKKTINACYGRGVYEISEVRIYLTKLTHQLSFLLQVILLMVVFSQVEFGIWDDFSQDSAARPDLFPLSGHHSQLTLLIVMIKYDRPVLPGPGLNR